MSLISEKAQEIANQQLQLITSSSAVADAIQADILLLKEQIISLTNEIAQKNLEIEQLQNTLANIGTVEQMAQIFAPVQTGGQDLNTKLNTIEQAQ